MLSKNEKKLVDLKIQNKQIIQFAYDSLSYRNSFSSQIIQKIYFSLSFCMILVNNFMDNLKSEYFQNLRQTNSPRAINISSNLSAQNITKLISESDFYVLSPRMKPDNDSNPQQLKRFNNRAIKLRTQPNMERLNSLSRVKPLNINLSQLQNQDDLIKKYQQELSRVKRRRQHYQEIKIQHIDLLSKLKQQKEIKTCIRQQQQFQKQIQYQKEQKIKRLNKQQKLSLQKDQKKQAISKRLQKLQEHKHERQVILSSKSLPMLPKYKVMEKIFMMQQLRWQVDKKVESKKLHEFRYKDFLKRQNMDNRKTQLKLKKRIKTEVVSQKVDEKEIQERRKQMIFLFEEKRKHRTIKVNSDRSHQFQIARDKAENPKKYHFLKLKNLTDEQIFQDFKDFQMNFDNKTLGNQYLEQSKVHLKKDPIVSSQIEKTRQVAQRFSQRDKTSHASISSKTKSRVYSHTKLDGINKKKQEISKILRGSESKSKIVELLAQQSLNSSKAIDELENQLAKPAEYQQLLKIENSIDSEYLQFLKSKIMTLGVQLH